MRKQQILILCLTLTILLLYSTRLHLRDLAESVGAYCGITSYLHHRPEASFRYPALHTTSTGQPRATPPIMHQIFLTDGRNSTLASYAVATQSCRMQHPAWIHCLWTDENAKHFMREHYPSLAAHYEGYRQTIQRANVLRYALLDHFGGIYLDLNITCRAPLDDFLRLPWLTTGAHPAGVNDAFILSRPHHPLLAEVLTRPPGADLHWRMPHVENVLSTGCTDFSNGWTKHPRTLVRRSEEVLEEDGVYVMADEEGDLDRHMLCGKVTTPLIAHAGASRWHGWSPATVSILGKVYDWFLVLLVLCLSVGCALLWALSRPSRVWRYKSSALGGQENRENVEDGERLLKGKEQSSGLSCAWGLLDSR